MPALRPHWLLPDQPFAAYADYLKALGGSAIARARAMAPEAVVAEIAAAGLRGRGGAGFVTGTKWNTIATHACPIRDVVCNAAEGEPGTFKDRLLLRRNPYAPLEGMLVAAHATRARAGYFALRGSFKPELAAVRRALAELTAAGMLADFPIQIVEGPEDYLFGEEKALLNVIDGEGPLPRPIESPPYEVGIGATALSPNPALVNNAETFAHAATILAHGAASFRALGTDDTPGTILVTLSGTIARPGVYEVEAGIPLSELFSRFGGGPPAGLSFQAALSGVSSGIIPAHLFETRADFGSLARIKSGLGSAGFILIDDQTDLGRVAQAVARFLYLESCNQCSACKVELRAASHALDELCDDAASTAPSPPEAGSDCITRAIIAAEHAPQGNRCYLPVQGAILLPSLLNARNKARGAPFELPRFCDFDEAARRFELAEPLKAH